MGKTLFVIVRDGIVPVHSANGSDGIARWAWRDRVPTADIEAAIEQASSADFLAVMDLLRRLDLTTERPSWSVHITNEERAAFRAAILRTLEG